MNLDGKLIIGLVQPDPKKDTEVMYPEWRVEINDIDNKMSETFICSHGRKEELFYHKNAWVILDANSEGIKDYYIFRTLPELILVIIDEFEMLIKGERYNNRELDNFQKWLNEIKRVSKVYMSTYMFITEGVEIKVGMEIALTQCRILENKMHRYYKLCSYV